MAFVRVAFERALLLLFSLARAAFLAQGLALCTALFVPLLTNGQETPRWLGIALRSTLAIAATLFVTGILLLVARHRITPRTGGDAAPTWPWPLLLGLSLAGLPLAAATGAVPLLELWGEIADLLHRVGFWEAFARSDPFAGIVLLPILFALVPPILEACAAAFLVGVPLALLVLLPTRSRLFPRLFVMTVACQAGLVLASVLAADAFSRIAAEAIGAMSAAEDLEVSSVAEALGRAAGVLRSTAAGFVAPLAGFLVWLPALLLSRQVGAFFEAGRVEPQHRSAPDPSAPVRAERGHAETPAPGAARHRPARVALVALGLLMLATALPKAFEPRTAFVSSEPAPGSTLASPAAAIRVRFDLPLDPSSSLSVIRTSPDVGPIGSVSSLDPDDAKRTTLRAEPSGMSAGLFRVDWRARPAGGGVLRHGAFYFGVETPVPEALAAGGLPVEEREVGQRRSRQTLAGGAILIALGTLLPWLPRRR